MSYYTNVRISYYAEDEADEVKPAQLLAAARKWLEKERSMYAIDDILDDLKKGLDSGTTDFSDLESTDLGRCSRRCRRRSRS